MRIPTSRTARIATAAATPVAVLTAAALIWQSSYAAFTGSTRNSGNEWATGAVALTDDDSGASRFQVEQMTPGETDTKCITVTADATVPGIVKGYAVNPVTSPQGLEDHIDITVASGSGGSFDDCAGFVQEEVVVPTTTLADLAAFNSYDSAIGGWPVNEGTQSRTYSITWTFDTAGLSQSQVDALQGSRTGIDFQWELQSTN